MKLIIENRLKSLEHLLSSYLANQQTYLINKRCTKVRL